MNTGASLVGKKNGAPRIHQFCRRFFSSSTAFSTCSRVRSPTLACSASSAEPGGLFWMPHRPAASRRSAPSTRSVRWWTWRRNAMTSSFETLTVTGADYLWPRVDSARSFLTSQRRNLGGQWVSTSANESLGSGRRGPPRGRYRLGRRRRLALGKTSSRRPDRRTRCGGDLRGYQQEVDLC